VIAHQAGLDSDRLASMDAADLRAFVEGGSHRYRTFLDGAAGVTVIVESLLELTPSELDGEVVWPAYEDDLFVPQPADDALRRELGLAADERVVVYAGNTHALNAQDVRSLYRAVALLREEGRPLRLVRLGDDHVDLREPCDAVIHVPYRPRHELPRYLALADVLVQPGGPDRFNDYRFPAKLPELLAMGRPVVLPRCNVGLHLREGEQCLLLDSSDDTELAARIRECLDDAALSARLGAGGRAFAEEHFSWPRSARKLSAFYERVIA
jgi:glycosyltransferase involved in cell wall biosynthesis